MIKIEQIELVKEERYWEQQVKEARSLVDNNWRLGEITLEVLKTAKYGESTLSQFARQVGTHPASLYRYKRVAEEITPELKERFEKILSFCMFEELIKSGVSPKRYKEYLERAVTENYSVAEFGRFLSGTLSGTLEENIKPVMIKFPGELRGFIDEIFDTLAQELKVGADSDYSKNKNILTAFVIACKDHLEGCHK
ncbi:MAG: hypothetical protein ACE5HR_00345 [bacterium]